MFHRFKHMHDGDPFLVSATNFEYEAKPTMTFLKAVTHVGYRDGVAKKMPPLEFTYTESEPAKKQFKPLTLDPGHDHPGSHGIPGFLENGSHQLVDLYGEGLPGILYTNDDTVLYSRPKGEGRFEPYATPDRFPIERNLQNAACTLTDLAGDGKLDLVVTTPTRSGYYESHLDGRWEPYRSFAATPTELLNPHRQMVDVTGDGQADLLLFEPDTVKVYASKGRLGYDQLQQRPAQNRLPLQAIRRSEKRFASWTCLATAAATWYELEMAASNAGRISATGDLAPRSNSPMHRCSVPRWTRSVFI